MLSHARKYLVPRHIYHSYLLLFLPVDEMRMHFVLVRKYKYVSIQQFNIYFV